MFKQAAGLDWVTVHYKGGPPAVPDLLAGKAHVMFANISDVITQVKAGKLRAHRGDHREALGGRARAADARRVARCRASTVSTWQAVLAPAGTPREIVQRLNAEIVKAMALPEMKERFLSFGTDAATSTPEELGRFLAAEVAKIGKIAQDTGAQID